MQNVAVRCGLVPAASLTEISDACQDSVNCHYSLVRPVFERVVRNLGGLNDRDNRFPRGTLGRLKRTGKTWETVGKAIASPTLAPQMAFDMTWWWTMVSSTSPASRVTSAPSNSQGTSGPSASQGTSSSSASGSGQARNPSSNDCDIDLSAEITQHLHVLNLAEPLKDRHIEVLGIYVMGCVAV